MNWAYAAISKNDLRQTLVTYKLRFITSILAIMILLGAITLYAIQFSIILAKVESFKKGKFINKGKFTAGIIIIIIEEFIQMCIHIAFIAHYVQTFKDELFKKKEDLVFQAAGTRSYREAEMAM